MLYAKFRFQLLPDSVDALGIFTKTSEEIMKLLEEINERGTTVLVVTHNKEIVNSMKKRVLTMHNGVIISDEKEGEYYEA